MHPVTEEYDLDKPVHIKRHVFKLVVPEEYYKFIHPLKQPNIRRLIQDLPDSVEQLWVFGSVVTRNHFPWSDVDILCIGEKISYADIDRMKDNLDCDNDVIVTSREEFRKYQNVFGHCFYHVIRDGIKYFDRSWSDV